jgi:cytochrome P450
MATEQGETGSGAHPFFGPEMLADPYPFYHLLRSKNPVLWMPQLDAWLITSYEFVSQALRNPQFSSDRFPRARQRMAARGLKYPLNDRVRSMIHTDAPDHTRLRGLVNKAFTPQVVAAMEPHIQSIVDELLDSIPRNGAMDLIEQIAYPLPVTVIAELLGLPTRDREQLKQWSDEISLFLSGDVGGLTQELWDRVVKARRDLADYLLKIVNERRAGPGDDLLSALTQAEENGVRLSDDELLSTAILLLVAGNETTTNLIGNGMFALLRHPEQQQRIWNDETSIGGAVEEMLRFDSPVQLTNRLAKTDVDIGGVTIKRGQVMYLILGAANRDPAQFDNPDTFDVTRANNKHLAFAAGPHFCVGAPLARLEGQVVLRTLRERYPNLRLGPGRPAYRENFNLRGLKTLQLEW